MFDPRSSYHRRMWHYESGTPLSVAQLISLGSLDARTAALLWLLIEHHQSLIVSGPTDPTPGVGKTTTLNALLGFLPTGSTMVYTVGMYEEFDFLNEVQPETTCVLANEVSDHLSIYMWGRVARRFLKLPEQNFAIATSCHADTVSDVLAMLTHELKLPVSDVQRLGIIVNIGLVGRLWPPRRRFLTVNFVRPVATTAAQNAPNAHAQVELIPLATWDATTDTFIPATAEALAELATIVGQMPEDFSAALESRTALMETLAEGRGVGMHAMREAMEEFLANADAGDSSASDAQDGAN
jgi:energy-coupling factor transporter ATP-binding protein EcfA2